MMDFTQFARKSNTNKKNKQYDFIKPIKPPQSNNNSKDKTDSNNNNDEVNNINNDIINQESIDHSSNNLETNSNSDNNNNENSIENYALENRIPISYQIDLKGHTKAITTISIEPAGNRLATGSLDYYTKLYDFGGMDSRQRAFHSIEAQDNHYIVNIDHSPNGDRFVVATGSAQPKVYDRDGNEVIKFVKGDMYLRDLNNTKGHTMEVTDCSWHPIEKDMIITSSLDGSVRIWNLLGEATFGNLINKHVLKIRGATGQHRIGATCCCYSPNGKKIAGGAADGNIHIWIERKYYTKSDYILRVDKEVGKPVRIEIGSDNMTMVARYDSGNVILWNISNAATAKAPVKIIPGMNNDYFCANACFSPDMRLLCCGTAPQVVKSNDDDSEPNVRKSRLYFFEVEGESTLPAMHIAIAADASAIVVKWQAHTNQIFCGLSNGDIRVLYDPVVSKKGALLSANRAPKRLKDPSDYAVVGEIYNPLALPMYKAPNKEEQRRKRKMELKDPYVAKIPDRPNPSGPGNRPNTNFFYTKYVMEGRTKDSSRLEDPREALLRVAAEEAAGNTTMGSGILVNRAYAQSQPKTLLHQQTFEEEQAEFKKRQKKF